MKKIISLIISLSLLSLLVLTLGSCGEMLDAPSGLYLNEDTLELSWERVDGAKTYHVVINGPQPDEQTVRNPKISLQYLSAGKYEISITAKGNEVEDSESEAVTYSFDRPAETGLKYSLINGNTEYELVGGGTAEGDVVMESVYRGKPVTSIAEKALYNNGKITSLVIPDSVTSIGKKAFAKATALTSVTVPESVTEIGEYAFQSCKALEKVTLPNSITRIPSYLFSWCSSLTELKLGNAITVISEYAFSNCTSLPGIVFPAMVTEIGDYAFSDCSSLGEAVMGYHIKRIGDSAFRNCKALATPTVHDGVEYVGAQAFAYCESITEIELPDSVTELGSEAFLGCVALESADIGDSIITLGYNVFTDTPFYENAEDLFYVNGWLIEVKNKNLSAVTLPEEIYGVAAMAFQNCENFSQLRLDNVVYVGEYAFIGCSKLQQIIFGKLEKLGVAAFYECKMLINVFLGDSLTVIDDFAFYGCEKIVAMELPDTLTTVGTYAFIGTAIYSNTRSGVVYVDDWAVGIIPSFFHTDIVVKDGTRGVADYAFFKQTVLYSVVFADTVEYIGRGACLGIEIAQFIILPKNLKVIGDYAFYGCLNAKYGDYGKTVIPEGTEYIGRSAFYENDYVIDLRIPSTVKAVGDFAFYGCDYLGCLETDDGIYLGDLVIEEGVESIGYRAFQGCINIDEVVIPDSVTHLGSHAFYKCEKLKNVTLGTGITEIGDYTFFKCPELKTVSLGREVKRIGKCAFSVCDRLESFDLTGTESVGEYAFYRCTGLTSLVLPETVKSIDEYAFMGCVGISSVVLHDSLEKVGKHAFYGLNSATLYCEVTEAPEGWDEKFNSSHRPAFMGVGLNEDGSVANVTLDRLENANALGGLSDPELDGYSFSGWTTVIGGTSPEYTKENLTSAPQGATLYAIWSQTDEASDKENK